MDIKKNQLNGEGSFEHPKTKKGKSFSPYQCSLWVIPIFYDVIKLILFSYVYISFICLLHLVKVLYKYVTLVKHKNLIYIRALKTLHPESSFNVCLKKNSKQSI